MRSRELCFCSNERFLCTKASRLHFVSFWLLNTIRFCFNTFVQCIPRRLHCACTRNPGRSSDLTQNRALLNKEIGFFQRFMIRRPPDFVSQNKAPSLIQTSYLLSTKLSVLLICSSRLLRRPNLPQQEVFSVSDQLTDVELQASIPPQ